MPIRGKTGVLISNGKFTVNATDEDRTIEQKGCLK